MTPSLLFPELAELPGFAFPQSLTETYRPQRIADFAGLSEAKRSLQGFAANPRESGMLFLGSAGTGKTSMGIALAREIGGFLHHVESGEYTVDKVRELKHSCNYYPPQGFGWHVVLVDEVDCASYAAQIATLSCLDGTATIPRTVFVFTCNSTDKLHDRFLSRNRVVNFTTYGIQADAAKLLERVWAEQTDAPAPNMAAIIKAQNGNVRAALQVLDSKLDALRA